MPTDKQTIDCPALKISYDEVQESFCVVPKEWQAKMAVPRYGAAFYVVRMIVDPRSCESAEREGFRKLDNHGMRFDDVVIRCTDPAITTARVLDVLRRFKQAGLPVAVQPSAAFKLGLAIDDEQTSITSMSVAFKTDNTADRNGDVFTAEDSYEEAAPEFKRISHGLSADGLSTESKHEHVVRCVKSRPGNPSFYFPHLAEDKSAGKPKINRLGGLWRGPYRAELSSTACTKHLGWSVCDVLVLVDAGRGTNVPGRGVVCSVPNEWIDQDFYLHELIFVNRSVDPACYRNGHVAEVGLAVPLAVLDGGIDVPLATALTCMAAEAAEMVRREYGPEIKRIGLCDTPDAPDYTALERFAVGQDRVVLEWYSRLYNRYDPNWSTNLKFDSHSVPCPRCNGPALFASTDSNLYGLVVQCMQQSCGITFDGSDRCRHHNCYEKLESRWSLRCGTFLGCPVHD